MFSYCREKISTMQNIDVFVPPVKPHDIREHIYPSAVRLAAVSTTQYRTRVVPQKQEIWWP